MKFLRKWLAALGLGMAALAAVASPTAPQNGVEFLTLQSPQPTDTGNKVEVIEFFGYFCPACYALDPSLKEWSKKQGANIVFKRVSVGYNSVAAPQQKLFYTLWAMGRLDDMHSKVFSAVQVERLPLRRDEQVFEFAEKNGLDRARFIELYQSSAIESYGRAASELQALFKIDGVPTVVIDGRYVTSMSMVAKGMDKNVSAPQLQAATLQVMDALVAKAKREHGTKSVVRI
jgi:thiol:disulfide interchange protein DsbA